MSAMAETIGVTSGLLTLAAFALNSSITLYNTVQSFRFHPKQVRDLNEELEALQGVLHPLVETVNSNTDIDLSALEIPLRRCGNACTEFEQEILKCSSRSGGNRTSFRDWAKLIYMGDGIDGFRQLLSGYKSTINIALTDASLRTTVVTAKSLENYQKLIQTATDDLEAHLQVIDEKLEAIFGRTVPETDSDAAELLRIKDERLSTEKGLQICAQLSDHISQLQLTPLRHSQSSLNPGSLPEIVTNKGLQECKESLNLTAAKLEKHMHELIDRLITKSKTSTSSEEDRADLARLQDEWETARQCIGICSTADTHLRENISIIDNYATGDETIQFLVSTDGTIIHGKNQGFGWRQKQVGGHLSDESLQQLSRDISSINIQNVKKESPLSQDDSPSDHDTAAENPPAPGFRDRYGHGFKLTSKTSVDQTTLSESSTKAGQRSPPKN